MTEKELRNKVVETAKKYIGCKEADGSHRKIIDGYNAHKPLARGYKVTYTDAWCATFTSFVFIQCGLTGIAPTECGCSAMISLYQKMGRWQEDDAYVPQPGDIIMYDWQDNGAGDNRGSADHVGIVVSVSCNTIKVIEGNISDSVGYRSIAVNGKYIRGYCLPDYASKAASGTSGSGETASSGASGGLNLNPQWVGVVTTSILNVRVWAGESANKLMSYPQIKKGTEIDVCDSVKAADGSAWYYVRINGSMGIKYGFVSAQHISKASGAPGDAPKEYTIGSTVEFIGNTHYTSSYETAKGKAAKACKAQITNMNLTGAHPYHVKGSGVNGWVNVADVK